MDGCGCCLAIGSFCQSKVPNKFVASLIPAALVPSSTALSHFPYMFAQLNKHNSVKEISKECRVPTMAEGRPEDHMTRFRFALKEV